MHTELPKPNSYTCNFTETALLSCNACSIIYTIKSESEGHSKKL